MHFPGSSALRYAAILVALLVGAVPLLTAAGPATAAPTPAEEALPLRVELTRLTPGVLPHRGPIRVSGTISNRSDETWESINVYPFWSTSPITTASELAAAAAAADGTYDGTRVIDPRADATDRIEEIPPGDSAPFSFTIPQRLLGDLSAGVYSFGIHALGTSTDGRDRAADGVLSTFLPRVERNHSPVRTAVVIPLRHRIEYAADGSLADVEQWTHMLTQGRLDALVDLGASAGDRTLTWAIDPALVDAVRQLSEGNLPRSLGRTVEEDPADPDAPESPTPSPTAARTDPALAEVAGAAEAWLSRLRRTVEAGDELLLLPYGDIDAAAAAEHDPSLLRRAFERGGRELGGWDVQGTSALVPPSGYLPAEAIAAAPGGATIVVGDQAIPARLKARGPGPGAVSVGGERLVVASSGASDGGPGTSQRRTAIAVRQRMLSEAALRHATDLPLTVVFRPTWVPDSATGFFSHLDQPWVEFVGVSDVGRGDRRPAPSTGLAYPESQEDLELTPEAFAVAEDVTANGSVLQNILPLNDQVADVLTGEALTTLSYSARTDPAGALRAGERTVAWVEEALGDVRVEAPRAGVTLTSTSGSFAADVANELDQPVSVRLTVDADRVEVTVPETIELGPRSTQTVLIEAETKQNGIHNLRLALTDLEGRPLPSSDGLTMRAAQVSRIIWLFMGGGAIILFGAIALRLYRRVRDRSAGEPAAPGAG